MIEPLPGARNIKLVLSYDGTDFHGWQRQPGLPTIQGSLEDVIEHVTGTRSEANASGRTDAGVHAIGQVANFQTSTRLEPSVLAKAFNALLPRTIRVRSAEDVPLAFHATLDATSKRYRYVVDDGSVADPFALRYRWHVGRRLDIDRMRVAARALVGRHDYRSFETDWPNRATSVRTVFGVDVTREGQAVAIEAEADGFLYNMVRAMAGTLVLVGSGKRPESFAGDALAAQSRTAAGPTAPPWGLFLLWVRYGNDPQTSTD